MFNKISPLRNTYSKIHFCIIEMVSCNEGQMSPTCSLCPKTNDMLLNSWCDNDCYFEWDANECKGTGISLHHEY